MNYTRIVCLLLLCLLLCGCTQSPPAPNEEDAVFDTVLVSTAEELLAFFEAGQTASVRLEADIDMRDVMLKQTFARGQIELDGDGHTITSSASSLLRLEDGCTILLSNVTLHASQIAIGLLGGGFLGGDGVSLQSENTAIYATGSLAVLPHSTLTLISSGGAGIYASGLTLGTKSILSIEALTCAVSTARGDLLLEKAASLTCSAQGDNIVKTDGTLYLMENAVLRSQNTGDHNAARIGTLHADPTATLEAQGGKNGIGLFVVEQYEDVTLRGYCTPAAHQERGDGAILFQTP